MKELDDLIEAEEIVLFMACQVLNYSLTARVPKNRITNKIRIFVLKKWNMLLIGIK